MAEEQQKNGAPKDSRRDNGAASAFGKEEGKVELDLDDSPFLEDDEPEPESQEKTALTSESDAPAQEAPPSLKSRLFASKKKIIMTAGAAVLLFGAAIVVNISILPSKDMPPPPPHEPEKVAVAPVTPVAPSPPPVLTLQWEPFWVELKDTEGDSRFLTLRFSVPMENPALYGEMSGKIFILRDAVFYYLRNQPIISLKDETRVQAFKSELLTVMNEHLGSGKASEILIQEYFVQ